MAVFINYRREDSGGDVRAVYNALVERFGEGNVFLDVEGIEAGEQWEQKIEEALDQAAVTLVFIGTNWLRVLQERSASGRADHVIEEIRLALEHPRSRVLPVLIQDATMPAVEDLPAPIQALAMRNASEIRPTAWQDDFARLVRTLLKAGALPAPKANWILPAFVVVAILAIAAGAYFASRPGSGDSPPAPTPSTGQVRPTPQPSPNPSPSSMRRCISGFVWREARATDDVCVVPGTRDATAQENRAAESRRNPAGGPFGRDTCLSGFVWREAFTDDHVCVTPDSRTRAANDNRDASSRWVR